MRQRPHAPVVFDPTIHPCCNVCAMRALHLSDLHLSRYGESRYWTRPKEEDGWETLHSWKRWRIEGRRDRKQRPDKLRLLDPEGVIHAVRKWPNRKDDRTLGKLVSLAMERHLTSVEALVRSRPSAEDLASMLRVDPVNTNLRFLQIVDRVLPTLNPDLILITGDMTDNGFGYGLLTHYLDPWIKAERLLVVPGNHDTYEMFPRKGRKGRIVDREDSYRTFAEATGNTPNETGGYLRHLEDIAVVGLSSCKAPWAPLSASGEVSRKQLSWLSGLRDETGFREARLRLCLVHHHLLRMPFDFGKGSPMEVGLRLRNASKVMRVCNDVGIDIVFNGHRHHGYMVQLPAHPTIISSPSSTMGCKSSDMRYVWHVDLAGVYPHPQVYRFTDERALTAEGEDLPSEEELEEANDAEVAEPEEAVSS